MSEGDRDEARHQMPLRLLAEEQGQGVEAEGLAGCVVGVPVRNQHYRKIVISAVPLKAHVRAVSSLPVGTGLTGGAYRNRLAEHRNIRQSHQARLGKIVTLEQRDARTP